MGTSQGYVFISNSSKPTEEEQNSREAVKLTNISRPCLETALDMGYEVWFGVNRKNPESLECELPVHMYDSHTYRSLTAAKDNWIAYKNLMKILKGNKIDVIHCNTPIGGVMGRLCGKRAKIPHIIYTAHGFHFYKGAPLFNRIVLKWAEKIMAHWTDIIITMNQEDYEAAKQFRLRNHGKVYLVSGVGIDTKSYKNINIDKTKYREKLGLKATDIICISMGDLIVRKNYITAIKAIAKCNNRNIHYLICGKGPELKRLRQIAKDNNVEKQVHFLGFRSDIKELLNISDIYLFTTLQEGMPRSMMEAMASGLPCVASKIRGNVDLLEDNKGGFLLLPKDEYGFSKKIDFLANNPEIRVKMGQANQERIKQFDVCNVKRQIQAIYEKI